MARSQGRGTPPVDADKQLITLVQPPMWRLKLNDRTAARCLMRLAVIALCFFAWIAGSFTARACEFDTDCDPGSKCVKPGGQIYGVCVGGISPGNSNDQRPVYDQLDPNGTVGNTCSFDTDCGPGSRCLKGGGSIYGTCVR